jgi:AraC-like DNA-binding protein
VLARLAALAPSSFRARFAAEVGVPPRHYQLRQRLGRAKHLLLRDNVAIKAVAHELGFSDQLYFSRLFTQYEGISPRAFRRRFSTEPGPDTLNPEGG